MTTVNLEITIKHPTNPEFNQNIQVRLEIPAAMSPAMIPDYLLGALVRYFPVTQVISSVGEMKY